METEEDEEARKLRLRINFQQEIITLSKEVRNLKWLGFRVPLTIINKAHQANQVILLIFTELAFVYQRLA